MAWIWKDVEFAGKRRPYTPGVVSSNLTPPTTYSHSKSRLHGGCNSSEQIASSNATSRELM